MIYGALVAQMSVGKADVKLRAMRGPMTWIQVPYPATATELGMPGGPGWLGYDLTDDAYRDAFTYYEELGYRLTDLWGYAEGDPANEYALYACIWQESRQHPAQFTEHAIA